MLWRASTGIPATPAGLGMTVGWGARTSVNFSRDCATATLPAYLPVDLQASKRGLEASRGATRRDPLPERSRSTRLEQNEVCVLFRSDRSTTSRGGASVFDSLGGMLEVTSIRKGFVGGG